MVRSFTMMRIQDVILAAKTDVRPTIWGSGKIPTSNMPLSKASRRAYVYGASWRWRFVDFRALEQQFVVRLLHNMEKATAYAHLALRAGTDSVVVCSLEYHPDHFVGWHAHGICSDLRVAPRGTLVHGSWVRRVPKVRSFHRRTSINDDASGGVEAWLWAYTMRFYRIEQGGPLL